MLCLLLLGGQFAQFSFEINIQLFPEGQVDFVYMVDLFVKSLSLISGAL